MKLYVYCLVENLDTLATPSSGVSGAPVELMRVDDFALLVSQFNGDAAPPVTRDNALAHATVVRSMLDATTPLPFRFGTVVNEEQLRSYVTSRREALEAKLAQVRGCVEMSVKIILNTDQTETETASKAADQGPGAKFLKEKQREIRGSEHRAEQAKEVSAWLQEEIRPFVREEEISLCPTGKLILAAAHLVAREQVAKYRDRLSEARKSRPELHFLSSGPWPPYTFSNIELEFKTRFGVS